MLIFASAAFSQWRTGYFTDGNAAGQTAATIPWSHYTHVIHYPLKPTFSNGSCAWDTRDTSVSQKDIADFVESAHVAGVKALIGIVEDRSLTAIQACTTPANLAQFVTLISNFVKDHSYDGVDIEWGRGVSYTQYQLQYQDLIRALRAAMPSATLTVPISMADAPVAADVADDLDQINLMAYGLDLYHVPSALHEHTGYSGPTLQDHVTEGNGLTSALADQLSRAGAPSTKFGIGVPFYGSVEQGCLDSSGSIGISGPDQTSLTAISTRPISYRDLVASNYWASGVRIWDSVRQSEYIGYTGGTCLTDAYIPYPGQEQMQAAVAQVKTNNLGGIMTFDLPNEYQPSETGDSRYPLSSTIYRAISATFDRSVPRTDRSLPLPTRLPVDPTVSARAQRTTIARPAATPLQLQSTTFTYYVDALNGSDSNPGTLTLPWKTVAKVNATKLLPGQSVGFSRGATWREEMDYPSSGSAIAPIVYGAYGSGAAPILSGSNLIMAGWSKDSTNIWKANVSIQPNIVYFNGTRGIPVAAKAKITSALAWYWAASVLYVWSPTGGDPSVYYTAPGIEAGARARVLQTNNASYVTLDGLTIRDANALSDAMVNIGSSSVSGIVFQNCVVERGATLGIAAKGSAAASSLTIDHCTIQNNGGSGIWVYNQYASATFSNNTITGNGWASVRDNQEYSGIEDQLGNANIFGNTIYANAPVCRNAGSTGSFCHGIYAGASTAVANIHQNVVYLNTNGAGIKAIGSANIYGNTVFNNALSGVMLGQNNTTNVVYTIYSNIGYGNNTSNVTAGCIVEQSKGAGTIALTIENNTCYQNGGTSGYEIWLADSVTQLSIYNNLMYASPTRRTFGFTAAQNSSAKIDYNLHWRADGNPNIAYAGTYPSVAQWKALGYDAHAVIHDPLLNKPTSDFGLKSGSPGMGSGRYISGVSVTSAPNIGAL
jgi:hypothetical protein